MRELTYFNVEDLVHAEVLQSIYIKKYAKQRKRENQMTVKKTVKMRCASIDRNAELRHPHALQPKTQSQIQATKALKNSLHVKIFFGNAPQPTQPCRTLPQTFRAARHFKCNDADFIKIETFETLTTQTRTRKKLSGYIERERKMQ